MEKQLKYFIEQAIISEREKGYDASQIIRKTMIGTEQRSGAIEAELIHAHSVHVLQSILRQADKFRDWENALIYKDLD